MTAARAARTPGKPPRSVPSNVMRPTKIVPTIGSNPARILTTTPATLAPTAFITATGNPATVAVTAESWIPSNICCVSGSATANTSRGVGTTSARALV